MDLPAYLAAHLSASAPAICAAREHLLCRAHPLAAAAASGAPPEPLPACAARLAQQLLQHALQAPPAAAAASPRLCLYVCNEVLLVAAAEVTPTFSLPLPPQGWAQALAGALCEQLPALLRCAAAAEPALAAHYLPRLLGEWEARGLLRARELAAACWGALAGSAAASSSSAPLAEAPPHAPQPLQAQQQLPPDPSLLLPPGTLANALRLSAAQGVPPYTPLPHLAALLAAAAPAVEPGRLLVRLEEFKARLGSGEFARAPGAPAAPQAVQLTVGGGGGGGGGRKAPYGAYLAGSTARYDRFFADGDEAALQVGLRMGLVAPSGSAGGGGGSSASASNHGERAGLGMH